jgi:hypothetical protein
MKDYTPMTEEGPDRILLDGIENEKKPFRIHFDTSGNYFFLPEKFYNFIH